MSKQMAKVFRKAQGKLFIPDVGRSGPFTGCCDAIYPHLGPSEAKAFFSGLFRPHFDEQYMGFWWDYPANPESQTARIIALELAALIAEETP